MRNEKNKDNEGFFVQNQYTHLDFLSQKSQRLATALYMITNLFDPVEPLRLMIRECALGLLSDTLSLRESTLAETDERVRSILLLSQEIIAYCDVAYAGQMISEMNHHILKKECEVFMHELDAKKLRKNEQTGLAIPSTFFDIEDAPEIKTGASGLGATFEQEFFGRPKVSPTSAKEHKGHIKDIRVLEKITTKDASVNRKDMIVKTFKQSHKSSLTIKDISEFIKDCSEKTIQRQLIDLVKTGVLEKQGERRWSTYSLKK